MKRVLFLSFAHDHSSAQRRLEDAKSDNYTIVSPNFYIDKVHTSIANRIFRFSYLKIIPYIFKRRYSVIWAWGQDVAFFSSLILFFSSNTKLIWDITDINRHMLGGGIKSTALRLIERILICRADKLILSSECFYDKYYKYIISRHKVVVIENMKTRIPFYARSCHNYKMPICFIYAGIFRSRSIIEQILRIARIFDKEIEFHIHGDFDRKTFHKNLYHLDRCNNVKFFGRYHVNDIEDIYKPATYVWGYIDVNKDDNEKWLLTNRIYDAVAYQIPILANSNSYSGTIIEKRSIGLTSHGDDKSIVELIRHLITWSPETYANFVKAMPPPESVLLGGRYREMLMKTIYDPAE